MVRRCLDEPGTTLVRSGTAGSPIWPAGSWGDYFDPGLYAKLEEHVAWICSTRLWEHGSGGELTIHGGGKTRPTTPATLLSSVSALITGELEENPTDRAETTLWVNGWFLGQSI